MPPYFVITSCDALRQPLFKRVDSQVGADAAVVVQMAHTLQLSDLASAPGATVTALTIVEAVYAASNAGWAKAVLDAEAARDDAARINVVFETFRVEEDGTAVDAAFRRLPLSSRGMAELKFPPKSAPFGVIDAKGVAVQLASAKKVLVMCGAGISVAAGIPDFRSPGIGLYDNLEKYDLPEPEDLFTIEFLEEKPEVFYQVSNEMHLWPGTYAPTHTHHFLKLLADRGQLLRCYTQNIDGLERSAGLDPELLVEAHGSFAGATCIEPKCYTAMPLDTVRRIAADGTVPRCPKCDAVVKPDVVFFGEALPARFGDMLDVDRREADLLLVIGTSLVVYPFAGIADMMRPGTPRVLVNMELVGTFKSSADRDATVVQQDAFIQGDCQAAVQRLAADLGEADRLAAAYEAGKAAIKPPSDADI